MASPQLDEIIQQLRAQPFSEKTPLEQTRADFEAFAAMFPPAADIKREPVSADGVPAEWITAPNSSDAITVLYFHGGGFVIGSVNVYADLVSRIARASGARALSVDYRLAPRHPYPAAVERRHPGPPLHSSSARASRQVPSSSPVTLLAADWLPPHFWY